MIKPKKKTIVLLVAAAVLAAAAGSTMTLFAAPGDAEDPVVTLSYITQNILPKLDDGRLFFQVVELSEGQTLIGNAGTELILRMGTADIIATEKGGLVNATAGYDLANGSEMPANSLLIVPVSDGRGIAAKDKVLVMVKGDYTIQ